MNKAIYILQQGEYERTRNKLVSMDVKEIAKAYVKVIEDGGYGDVFYNPYIEIWVDGELINEFHDKENNVVRLGKFLSKLANKKEVNLLEKEEIVWNCKN